MGEIIRQGNKSSARNPDTSVSNWHVTSTQNHLARRRRIIKAGEVHFSPEQREVSPKNMALDEPVVKLLRKGMFIEGVEVTCRCGEKITIQFDVDENA
jgi:hypothetical protein